MYEFLTELITNFTALYEKYKSVIPLPIRLILDLILVIIIILIGLIILTFLYLILLYLTSKIFDNSGLIVNWSIAIFVALYITSTILEKIEQLSFYLDKLLIKLRMKKKGQILGLPWWFILILILIIFLILINNGYLNLILSRLNFI